MASDDRHGISDAGDLIGVGPGASRPEIEAAYRRLQHLLDVELGAVESPDNRLDLLEERAGLEIAFDRLMGNVQPWEAELEEMAMRTFAGDDIEVIDDVEVVTRPGLGRAAVFGTAEAGERRWVLGAATVVAVAVLAALAAMTLALAG